MAILGVPGDSIYLPQWAEITRVESLTEREKWFELRLGDGAKLGHLPGQFVEVSVLGVGEAPISICSPPREDDRFELCIRAMGNVTRALHRLQPGAQVGIRGPFGNGFPLDVLEGKDLLFVAGGIGLAPLRSLIHYVLEHRRRYRNVTILYGSKTPADLLFREDLARWEKRHDVNFQVTVDRPDETWARHVGVITTLFSKIAIDAELTVALVVGPPIMYRYVALECVSRGIPEQRILMSLERHMKCGVGKCGHCQINGKYVCQDGPVFSFAQIRQLKEALT